MKDTEDKFLIALKGSLALIEWNGEDGAEVEPVHLMDIVDDPNSGSRCNDGKVDPSNRLWVGKRNELHTIFIDFASIE